MKIDIYVQLIDARMSMEKEANCFFSPGEAARTVWLVGEEKISAL
jgi:hypothetical protein